MVQGKVKVKGKDIPVTGHGGPYGCERLRLPHYLEWFRVSLAKIPQLLPTVS
jgi:hypothetical protein